MEGNELLEIAQRLSYGNREFVVKQATFDAGLKVWNLVVGEDEKEQANEDNE